MCFLLGLSVCLFYALYYQQGDNTAVVLRAWFVRTNMLTKQQYKTMYAIDQCLIKNNQKWSKHNYNFTRRQTQVCFFKIKLCQKIRLYRNL